MSKAIRIVINELLERDTVSFSCEMIQKRALPRDDFQTTQFALLFTCPITEAPSIHTLQPRCPPCSIYHSPHNVSAVSDPTPFRSNSLLLSDISQPLFSLLLHGAFACHKYD